MNDTGFRGNTNLKRSGVKQEWTKKQILEYKKSMNDPIYFVEKYMKIVHIDKGVVPFKMWDFQKELIQTLHNNRFIVGKYPRQTGKCLLFETAINIRDKKTKEVKRVSIGELYEKVKECEM